MTTSNSDTDANAPVAQAPVSRETYDAAVNRIDKLEHTLRLIRDHQIPQGMSPALFAEKVLA